jgi:hypothetical protein
MSPTEGAQAGRGVAGAGGGPADDAGIRLPELAMAAGEDDITGVTVALMEADVIGATVESGDVAATLGGWWMTMDVMNEVNIDVMYDVMKVVRMAPGVRAFVSEVIKVEDTWENDIDHGEFDVGVADEETSVTEIVETAGILETIVDAVDTTDSPPEGINESVPPVVIWEEDKLRAELAEDEIREDDVVCVEVVEAIVHGEGGRDEVLGAEDGANKGLIVDELVNGITGVIDADDIITEEDEVEIKGSGDVAGEIDVVDEDEDGAEMAGVDAVGEPDDAVVFPIGIGTIEGLVGSCILKGTIFETGVECGGFVEVHKRVALEDVSVDGAGVIPEDK